MIGKLYYSLLSWDGARWIYELGDYDYDTVQDEQYTYLEHNPQAKLAVICSGDELSLIDLAMTALPELSQ